MQSRVYPTSLTVRLLLTPFFKFSLPLSLSLILRIFYDILLIHLLFLTFFLFSSSFFMNDIQHCFICRPSDYTVSEDAGIEPMTVATTALAVRRSNHARLDPIFLFFSLLQLSFLFFLFFISIHSQLCLILPSWQVATLRGYLCIRIPGLNPVAGWRLQIRPPVQ
jgi:hypothetical protein